MNNKNIQIPLELFFDCYKIICIEIGDSKTWEKAKKGLELKFKSIEKRELYTQYKTTKNREEQEKARQKYLNEIQIHKNFRY